jgi:predicted RND superfamily exporter protein
MTAWTHLMIRHRYWVMGIVIALTVGLMSQIGHLTIIVNSDNMMPQSNHFVRIGNEIESTFGNKNTVVVAVTPTQGTIYQTPILAKVQRITARLTNTPGVIKTSVIGLAAHKAKAIQGTDEGMSVRPLMEQAPQNDEEMQALKAGIASTPAYDNLLISRDARTTQIVAEFKEPAAGMKSIEDATRAAVDPERDASVEIAVGGLPIWLSKLEQFSARMAFLLPLALLVVGLIHFEAFGTVQALVLPLVTAVIAVIWAVSFLAFARIPLDVFNATTPILILAIAAGHAVQILKRYYEEYSRLRESDPSQDARERNRLAIAAALTRVGPVMVVACVVAALGFFSLVIFDIKSVRTFGVMTGIGVFSALILELTFIPALRATLRPPGEREYRREQQRTYWDRLLETLYGLVTNRRKLLNTVTIAVFVILSFGGYQLKHDSSVKGFFFGNSQIKRDDDKLNTRMAGTNTVYVLIDAGVVDGIKNPAVLNAMDKIQQHLQQEPKVGRTLSLADFIKRMNQAMNADEKSFYSIPASQDLVAQYLLLYSSSGEPQDFDSYVDNDYRKAAIQIFVKTDSTAELKGLVARTQAYADSVVPHGVGVRIGGGMISGVAIDEEMVRGKLLNILQILACVFVVSSLVFRSPLAGSLILIPLVATVFANFGFMGLLGIPLNIPNSLVAAMAVGVGADYAIYLSYRMREELQSGLPESEAIRRAFLSAGKATLFVSSAVAAGFGVLLLSWGFFIHIWMALLLGLAMLTSSIATLTIFASLILTLRPKFIFADKPRDLSWNAKLSQV